MSVSLDGRILLTASIDSMVRIWDGWQRTLLAAPVRYDDWARTARFAPDERRILTSSDDGAARIYLWQRFPSPAPEWVASLAEAVAGQRLNDIQQFEAVSSESLSDMRSQLASVRGDDAYALWLRWFLADIRQRPILPNAALSTTGYVAMLIARGTEQDLREAVRLDPDSNVAALGLARHLMRNIGGARESTHRQRLITEADRLSRAILTRDLANAEAWALRSAVWLATGVVTEAPTAVQIAVAANPRDPRLQLCLAQALRASGETDSALEVYSAGIALCQESGEFGTTRRRLFLGRSGLHAEVGRLEEAVRDRGDAYSIVARDPVTEPSLIDLSRFYNQRLDENFHSDDFPGNNLAELPTGLQTLAGVPFDIRGVIQLASRSLASKDDTPFPERVQGIPVAARCRRLFFLHASGYAGSAGEPVATYLVHYSDGSSVEIPVIYGTHLKDWWNYDETIFDDEGPHVAWSGANEALRTSERANPLARRGGLRLFVMRWDNPRLDLDVTSIDFASAMNTPAPFLIAVSADVGQGQPQ